MGFTQTARQLSAVSAAALSAGCLMIGLSSPHAAAQPVAQDDTATQQASAAARHLGQHAKGWAWMSIVMPHSVKGRTLTYHYADAGYQHDFIDGKTHYVSDTSLGFNADFGDGSSTGANAGGGTTCAKSGSVHHFSVRTITQKHHYAKPGTYKLKVTGYYCGDGGDASVTKTYTVKVR